MNYWIDFGVKKLQVFLDRNGSNDFFQFTEKIDIWYNFNPIRTAMPLNSYETLVRSTTTNDTAMLNSCHYASAEPSAWFKHFRGTIFVWYLNILVKCPKKSIETRLGTSLVGLVKKAQSKLVQSPGLHTLRQSFFSITWLVIVVKYYIWLFKGCFELFWKLGLSSLEPGAYLLRAKN